MAKVGLMRIGSLYSGIGGLELGLERAGLGATAWQVELSPYCRAVLARHWPDAERFCDVREVGVATLAPVDLICGGFPCQDLSTANTAGKKGLAGERSGLWREYRRIVSELMPKWVVVENVYKNWRGWVPTVRRELHGLGYASVCIRLRACDLGAPFAGDRAFVIATTETNGNGKPACSIDGEMAQLRGIAEAGGYWRDAERRVMGLANGVPGPLGAVRAYGNAVVPAMGQAVGALIASWL